MGVMASVVQNSIRNQKSFGLKEEGLVSAECSQGAYVREAVIVEEQER